MIYRRGGGAGDSLLICYHSWKASEKSIIEKTILQNPLQVTSWNIFRKPKKELMYSEKNSVSLKKADNPNKSEKGVSISHQESWIGNRAEKRRTKIEEKRLQQRAYLLLENLPSKEVAGEVLDTIKKIILQASQPWMLS